MPSMRDEGAGLTLSQGTWALVVRRMRFTFQPAARATDGGGMSSHEMEPLMTIGEVAKMLGMKESWVMDHTASGDLPSLKLGRYRRYDPVAVRAWIGKQQGTGKAA